LSKPIEGRDAGVYQFRQVEVKYSIEFLVEHRISRRDTTVTVIADKVLYPMIWFRRISG